MKPKRSSMTGVSPTMPSKVAGATGPVAGCGVGRGSSRNAKPRAAMRRGRIRCASGKSATRNGSSGRGRSVRGARGSSRASISFSVSGLALGGPVRSHRCAIRDARVVPRGTRGTGLAPGEKILVAPCSRAAAPLHQPLRTVTEMTERQNSAACHLPPVGTNGPVACQREAAGVPGCRWSPRPRLRANSRMTLQASLLGAAWEFSHRFTVETVTAMACANSSWVSPSLLRSRRITSRASMFMHASPLRCPREGATRVPRAPREAAFETGLACARPSSMRRGVAGTLLLGALLRWAPRAWAGDASSPEDVLKRYLQAVKDEKFDQVYDLVSKNMRQGKDKEAYVKEQKAMMGYADVKIFSFTVYPGKVEGEKAQVPNILESQDRFVNTLGLTEYELYTLVRENGAWKVDSQLLLEPAQQAQWFPKGTKPKEVTPH